MGIADRRCGGAFLLRAHHLSRIFLWLDETDFFNEYLYGSHPKSLVDFALTTRRLTTNTWGWPAIIWISCRVFGATIEAARACSVLAGTAAVVLVSILAYRLILNVSASSRFAGAIIAATLTAIAMPQMEFSQRTYPYAAVPLAAAFLILTHLEVYRGISDHRSGKTILRRTALYTVAGTLAVCIHPSLNVLLAVSAVLLVGRASREFFWPPGPGRIRFLQTVFAAGLILAGAMLINAKNPKSGYRIYLVGYYHPLSLRSIPRLAAHAYDLLTYHLNLFYNTSLYWPERVNWAILPLVLLCLLGWSLSGAGKFAAQAQQLALFGVMTTLTLGTLSIVGVFPFGGVRQTLLLSPFLLVFTALGFCACCGNPKGRILASLVATVYLAAWAFNLPRFYNERVAIYSAEDVVQAWQLHGKLRYYSVGSEREVQYTMRQHPEIEIESLPEFSKPPYLLVATHFPLEDVWFINYREYLRRTGYKAILVMEKPPLHLESFEHRTCLYFPPNGFWIYMVTAQ